MKEKVFECIAYGMLRVIGILILIVVLLTFPNERLSEMYFGMGVLFCITLIAASLLLGWRNNE